MAGGGYTADQLAKAYGFDTLYAKGDLGAGQTIAIYSLQSFTASDIATFQSCYRTTTSVTTENVDGGAPAGGDQGEAVLDIENAVSLAPKAHILVYSAPNPSGAIDDFNQIVSDDTAQVVTTSYGTCEPESAAGDIATENTIFQMAAAQGQSILDAAGDSGSEDCFSATDANTQLAVDDPAGQPFITGVGGTTLTAVGPAPTERVWNDGPGSGGGGGISSQWAMPSYQHGSGVVNTHSSSAPCAAVTGTTALCREVPDLAAVADPNTGFTVYQAPAGWSTAGGTSGAAPLVAALVALANEGCTKRAGFLNPALYNSAAAGPGDFNDVTLGNNDANGVHGGLFPAGVGYDMASGLGSPIGGKLATDLCAGAPAAVPLATAVAASPDGATLYVAQAGGNQVSVVTAATNTVTARVGVGTFPDALAYSAAGSPDGAAVYVSNYRSGTVSVLDPLGAPTSLTATVTVGKNPAGVVASPDGSTVYVANGGSGTVSVIDTATNTATHTINVGGGLPSGLALSADGTKLYVANATLHTLGVYRTTTPFTRLAIATLPAGSQPAYVAVSGSTAYVATPGANAVEVVKNAATTPVLSSVAVGIRPFGVAVVPGVAEVVATNSGSNTLSVLNTAPATPTVIATHAVGSIPDGVTAAVTGGSRFAYVADEGSGTISKVALP